MLSLTYEITTALSHTDELISPPYDIAIVTISYGRVTKSPVWDTMMSKKNMGWPFYAAVYTISCIGPCYNGIRLYVTVLRISLHWRHNDHDGVSNHQPHGCLLNRLFRRRSKKTPKLRVTGLCVGNSPGPVNSPHKGLVTRKMFPFDDVIMYNSYLKHTCVGWTCGDDA